MPLPNKGFNFIKSYLIILTERNKKKKSAFTRPAKRDGYIPAATAGKRRAHKK